MGNDDDEQAIRERRRRLIALALSGAMAATGTGIGGCVPCLSPPIDASNNPIDAGPDAGIDAGE